MAKVEATLTRVNLRPYWLDPYAAVAIPKEEWRSRAYEAVDAASDHARATRMRTLSSTITYARLKEWGVNTAEYSFSVGEVGRLGQHVPERYLGDRTDLKGTRLKLLCRTRCLPLLDRVGREARPLPWPKELRTCLACHRGVLEDVHHFVMDCPLYAIPRARLFEGARRALHCAVGPVGPQAFDAMAPAAKLLVLLGRRIADPFVENRIDKLAKLYLKKAWTARSRITALINHHMNTTYYYEEFKYHRG
jgi:hypothetical protein